MTRIPHTIRTRGGALMATALAVAVVGCGSSASSPSAAIRHVVTSMSVGLASGNGSEACSSFTAAAQKAIVKQSKADGVGSTCEQAVRTITKHLTASQKSAMRSLTVSHVSIKGDTATVTERLQGHSSTDTLTKVNGRWYLNADTGG